MKKKLGQLEKKKKQDVQIMKYLKEHKKVLMCGQILM